MRKRAVRALDAQELIACYRRGVFPMAEAADDPRVYLIDPDERGVFPLERFHVPRRLARTVRQNLFEVRIDTAFDATVAACAEASVGREETWINPTIQRLYGELFHQRLAHSVECWLEDRLVGGLYGVALGGAFFGESMFSRERDASKVALVHLIGRLIVGGYRLLDAQFQTEHLEQFGAEEIDREQYQLRLAAALVVEADFYRLTPAEPGVGSAGATVLQAINQTS